MSNEKYKVVYFLGAGASCKNGALPLVADYCERLKKCGEALEGIPSLKDIKESLLWLAEKGNTKDGHNTVDSFAKWCSRNDEGSLHRVKEALTFFFSMEECVQKKRDTRYVQFITEMIDDNFKFPKNVKIINWNYDSQVQIACDMNRRREDSNTYGIVQYYPNMFIEQGNNIPDYDMIHMNGIARMYQTMDGKQRFHPLCSGDMQPLMNSITMSYYNSPVFNFAFETDKRDGSTPLINYRINLAKEMVKDADIVVIIGYSFPSVNDFVDGELFNIMKQGKGLKKIYVQSPQLSLDAIKRRFDLPDTTLIESVPQLDSFHIALEYRRSRVSQAEAIENLIKNQTAN